MKNKIIKLFLFLVLILILLEVYFLISSQKISVGVSESLPFHVFLVNTNKKNINIKNGDFIQFQNKNTKYYNGKNITKQVLASSGDIIKINQFSEVENNIQASIQFNNVVLDVKEFTALGTKLNTNNVEIIPENYFFVIGTNKNSFDSRYKEFGLINKEDIIGVAKPLF